MERTIRGKKPQYPTYLESVRTLSQVQAEAALEQEKIGGGVLKPRKTRKVKPKKFVSCLECKEWVTTELIDSIPHGSCRVGIMNCPHSFK